MYKKKELQLSYFSICEGKKLDDKIVTYFALKTGSTVCSLELEASLHSSYATSAEEWKTTHSVLLHASQEQLKERMEGGLTYTNTF